MKLFLVFALVMAVSSSASQITAKQATDIVANAPVEKAAQAVESRECSTMSKNLDV